MHAREGMGNWKRKGLEKTGKDVSLTFTGRDSKEAGQGYKCQ